MHKKFYRWEIALAAGILAGILSWGVDREHPAVSQPVPETYAHARYQIQVLPFGIGHTAEDVMASEWLPKETEFEIRYYFPKLWEKIRAAIGL